MCELLHIARSELPYPQEHASNPLSPGLGAAPSASMIDIHIHILHGLDDGPGTLAGSVELANAAVDAGTTTVVATPHIRDDYPFDLDAIDERAVELRRALADARVPLEVATGGEV